MTQIVVAYLVSVLAFFAGVMVGDAHAVKRK